jgi:hypothetical protein
MDSSKASCMLCAKLGTEAICISCQEKYMSKEEYESWCDWVSTATGMGKLAAMNYPYVCKFMNGG